MLKEGQAKRARDKLALSGAGAPATVAAVTASPVPAISAVHAVPNAHAATAAATALAATTANVATLASAATTAAAAAASSAVSAAAAAATAMAAAAASRNTAPVRVAPAARAGPLVLRTQGLKSRSVYKQYKRFDTMTKATATPAPARVLWTRPLSPEPLWTKGAQELFNIENAKNMAKMQAARNQDIKRGVKFMCFAIAVLTFNDVVLFWLNCHISPRRMIAMIG